MFDFEKVEDFESHINMSIPSYDHLSNIFRNLTTEFADPDISIVDIGCSTCSFLNSLDVRSEKIGIDVVDISKPNDDVVFIKSDAYEFLTTIDQCSVVICMFSLQFLGKYKRELVCGELERLVTGGATLLISEKCHIDDVLINNVLFRTHMSGKRKNFDDTVILDKDDSLFGSMFCKTVGDMELELSGIGDVTKVWQSYNFHGWVVR